MKSLEIFTRGCWRLMQPFRQRPIHEWGKTTRMLRQFLADRSSFRASGGEANFDQLSPALFDRSDGTQTGGGHYFFQDIWALSRLEALQPPLHYDVGSRIDGFVGQATAICPVVYVDIRPPRFVLPRFEFREGDILRLPFENNSLSSLSCLHVVEHVGLGRYGDRLNPTGAEQALMELGRVLGTNGQLLLSLPIGRERVEFNAQRVCNPLTPVDVLICQLQLLEFSVVDDCGQFITDAQPEEFAEAKYACGLYRFTRTS